MLPKIKSWLFTYQLLDEWPVISLRYTGIPISAVNAATVYPKNIYQLVSPTAAMIKNTKQQL